MSKTAIVFLADGFEEVEAITPIDYLRRAGVDVTTVSISGSRIVTGSHGISVTADAVLADIAASMPMASMPMASVPTTASGAGSSVYDASGRGQEVRPDAMLLPGGMPGAANLAASGGVGALLKEQAAAGRIVAAICASPAVVLAPLGLLAGRRFTCYPEMEGTVTGAKWSEERVVIDGNIITSRGAGTAAEWAIALIGALVGKRDGEKIAGAVLL